MSEFMQQWDENEDFRRFSRQVYDYLINMKPGSVLVLDSYKGEQLKWIIQTACVFIMEGYNSIEYEFNETYTEIIHREIEPDLREWIINQFQQPV